MTDKELDIIDEMALCLVAAIKFIDKSQWTGCYGDGMGGPCSGCHRCKLLKRLRDAVTDTDRFFGAF